MKTTPGSGAYYEVPRDDPDLLYDRCVRTRARMVDDKLVVSGWLSDETWGPTGFIRVHDMGLSITCDPEGLTIVDASAEMRSHPHGTCPLMIPSAERLLGLSVTNGYLNEVRKRMGGVRGCNHLYALAQSVGTVAALTFAARRVHRHPELATLTPEEYFQDVVAHAPGVVGSCHVWRREGEVATALLGPSPDGTGDEP